MSDKYKELTDAFAKIVLFMPQDTKEQTNEVIHALIQAALAHSAAALAAKDAEIARLQRAVKAASAVAELYVDIANSGDAGFWNPEKVPEVIEYRAALSAAQQEG